jgi:hypothetical protein
MLLGANASQEAAKANQLASSQVDIRHKYLRFGGRNYFLLPSAFCPRMSSGLPFLRQAAS